MPMHELAAMLRAGELTSADLTSKVLARIKSVEKDVAAYLVIDEEGAMRQAEQADVLLKSGVECSMLTGIPMALKDNMCTTDMTTTCASRILEGFVAPYEATVASKLRAAGSVILGKANMDEFAMGSSTENSAFQKTLNPWNIKKVPGGSSGGSAASVAAGEAIFSLGSDTGGSIRQPAAFCGVVGMKPTYGAVSRYGLVAFASSLDQIGPFTRDVKDCALVLDAICGHDKRDTTSATYSHPAYHAGLNSDIKGKRIALPREFFGEGIDDDVRKKVMAAVDVLRGLGAICEEISLPNAVHGLAAYYVVAPAEASSNLARFDGVRYGFRKQDAADLLDMYASTRSAGFGAEVKRRIMIGTYALSSGYYDAYYLKALKVRRLIHDEFEAAFCKYDAVLTPTTPTVAFTSGEKTSDPLAMYMSDICTIPANLAGIPAVSLPCGFSGGMPVGMQLMGKAFAEPEILSIALAFEKNTDHHNRRPEI